MNKYSIVIKHSIFINKPREQVWDFTQDYNTRHIWDHSIKDAYVVEYKPNRIIRLKTNGNTTMTLVYKQDQRPYKTSLATTEVQSQFIESAGGSWIYEEDNGGTNWTQRNTILLKSKRLFSIFLPFFRWMLTREISVSMNRAKQLLETN